MKDALLSTERRSLAQYNADGHSYELSLASPADANAIVRLYESMDFDSIFSRFMGIFKNFEEHVANLFSAENELGFAVLGREGEELVAEGEAFGEEHRCTELAPIVHPKHRKLGLGSVVVALLVIESYRRGAKCAEVYFLFDNTPMYRIATELGMKFSVSGNVFHGVVDASAGYNAALKMLEKRGAAVIGL